LARDTGSQDEAKETLETEKEDPAQRQKSWRCHEAGAFPRTAEGRNRTWCKANQREGPKAAYVCTSSINKIMPSGIDAIADHFAFMGKE
jgi:hypothetical protein